MNLPTNAKDTNKAVADLVRNPEALQQFYADLLEAPSWVHTALDKGLSSVPILMALVPSDDVPDAERIGFSAGVRSELIPTLLGEILEKAEQSLETNPDERTQSAINDVKEFLSTNKKGLEKLNLDYLSAPSNERDDFIEGLRNWAKKRPYPLSLKNENIGNSATWPHIHLAIFWRGFAELKSLEEAYFALFCMFDKDETRSGTYEAFRKRARAIGLTYTDKR